MLTRAYRLSDRLGIVALKSSVGVAVLLAENMQILLGATRRTSGGTFGTLAKLLGALLGAVIAVLQFIYRIFRRLLSGLFDVLAWILGVLVGLLGGTLRVAGSTAKIATGTAGGAMARRAARAEARNEIEVGLAEDPLRIQNRLLSGLVVVVLVALIGVVLWATSNTGTLDTPFVPNAASLNADGSVNTGDAAVAGQSTPQAESLLGATPVPTATDLPGVLDARGSIAYVVREQGQTDLWASPVDSLEQIRITNDEGDERDPAWEPNGQRLAYASNKDGNWELYIYNLATNDTTRMTLGLSFEANPTWSPDGVFIAYEAYQPDTHLDILVMRSDGSEVPTRIASSDSADFSPAWSPDGRRIAFTSWRDGNQDIYIFSLDDGVVTNITNTPNRQEDYAAWSPDGDLIAYSAVEAGIEAVYVKSTENPAAEPEVFRLGRMPSWSPDGDSIIYANDTADSTRIIASPYSESGVSTQIIQVLRSDPMPVWTSEPIPAGLINAGGLPPARESDLFVEQVAAQQPPFGLGTMINITSVEPAVLSDRVNDSFNALRVGTNSRAGWDFLGNITDALWDLNYRPEPGVPRRNWHMTGRAFSFNRNQTVGFPPPIEIVREDTDVATFWRVFVRVDEDAQNGQLGEPLRTMPWVFTPPEDGDVEGYEQGGRLRNAIPEGYYIDFTQLAADYGWSRIAAGPDWRFNFNVRNYWIFQKREGLTWYDAMLEIYEESQLGGFVPTATPLPPTPIATPTDEVGTEG